MKLWDKGTSINSLVENFTVGKDREMDLYLAKFDVLGSIAHAKMLQSINLLTKVELAELQVELVEIYKIIEKGDFRIEDGVEDVHSQVELMLTRKLGDTGKKIHSGRSRNDQVLLDLKLFTRSEIQKLVESVCELFDKLLTKATGIPSYVADDALFCVAKGTGVALENLDDYKRSVLAK